MLKRPSRVLRSGCHASLAFASRHLGKFLSKKMNIKIMPGSFVVGEVVSLPSRHGLGMIRWQTEKDGSYFRAPFRFEGGHKIVSRDGDPWFVNGRREPVEVGSWVIALVRSGRSGVFVFAWGHLSEYKEIVGEPNPVPELPGMAHILVKKPAPAPVKPAMDVAGAGVAHKSHHGSRPPRPRRYMTVADMANTSSVVAV